MLDKHLICKDTSEFAQARLVTFLNPYSFLKIQESTVDLSRFDKICIDGIALKIFLERVYKNTKIERLSFDFSSEVANLVFGNGASKRQRGFILGSDEHSNNEFQKKISDLFPGLTLDGRSGYFTTDEEQTAFLQSIANSQHDFVVIGMGAVKQEEAAIELAEMGFKGCIYTCGGFIHQTAMGDGEYYPAWVDKCNLRFAYRMFKEPATIRRYLIDYPKAFFLLTRNIRKFNY